MNHASLLNVIRNNNNHNNNNNNNFSSLIECSYKMLRMERRYKEDDKV